MTPKELKHAQKKLELTRNAIELLARVGFAGANMRDIAKQSGVSLGVLHYYFEDKRELIASCVRLYKEEFIAALVASMSSPTTPERLIERIVKLLVRAIRDGAARHRMWYDIRAQAMYDPALDAVVREIEASMFEVSARLLRAIGAGPVDPGYFYVLFDALFRHALHRHVMGDKRVLPKFAAQARAFMAQTRLVRSA